MDGSRVAHNRYRVYRSDGQGSYDLVTKNMRRFADLYPDYKRRSISLVLTADNDFLETNEVLKEFASSFPTLHVNYVNSSFGIDSGQSQKDCDDISCVQPISIDTGSPTPSFLDWTPERIQVFQDYNNRFLSELLIDAKKAHQDWPLFYRLFQDRFKTLHSRPLKATHTPKVACGCIPGSVRLYCDIEGNFFPCERVETNNLLKIGNVSSGIDSEKVQKMIEGMSEATRCRECVGKHVCSVCPSYITHSNDGNISNELLTKACNSFCHDLPERLAEYVSIQEGNPSIFPKRTDLSVGDDDWLSSKELYFITCTPSKKTECENSASRHSEGCFEK